jgi:hypothetical protein
MEDAFAMRRFGLPFLAVMLLGAALPVLAVPESAPDELQHNRRLLEQYRADPEHYARLVRDLRAFKALPPERQEKMRQFDRALHEEDAETQKHLWEVLERYIAWLDRLPGADQKRLDDLHEPMDKLVLVRELRQQEWIDRLPQAERQALDEMTTPMRAKRVAELREQERKQRQEWTDWANGVKPRPNVGPHSNKPVRLTDFPENVQTFVKVQLTPMLSEEENGRLTKAQGVWPFYAQTLLELSDKHPVLPPLPSGKIEFIHQLPKEAKETIQKKKAREELNKNLGKWPQFALAVAELVKQDKHSLALGASRPAEFPQDVQTFLKSAEVEKALTADDKTKLRAAEGHWPDYPLLLLKLAQKNNLIVPGMSLPGPPALWNSARNALPNVAPRVLEDFYSSADFSDEDRAKFNHAAEDPDEQLDVLKRAYFKAYPEKLERLRRLEQQGIKVKKP